MSHYVLLEENVTFKECEDRFCAIQFLAWKNADKCRNDFNKWYDQKSDIHDVLSSYHTKAMSLIKDMPYELYEKVKAEIPTDIGVYVSCHRELIQETVPNEYGYLKTWNTKHFELTPGFDELVCIKPAKKRLLRADKEVILSSMLRCACRDRRRGNVFGYIVASSLRCAIVNFL